MNQKSERLFGDGLNGVVIKGLGLLTAGDTEWDFPSKGVPSCLMGVLIG